MILSLPLITASIPIVVAEQAEQCCRAENYYKSYMLFINIVDSADRSLIN